MHVIAAASTRIPIALWTSMLSVWKRPGLPPLHSPIIPGKGWSGSRIGIEWAWLKFRAGKWVAIQRNRLQRRGTDRISVLRSLSERVGFPFDQEAVRFDWLVPFTFRSLPVLSFNALELEFPHQPHPSCRYVGPVLALDRPTPAWSAASAKRLGELFAAREADGRRSLIYCSFGAWHKGDDLDFLRRVVDAVSRHPDLGSGRGSRGTVRGRRISGAFPTTFTCSSGRPNSRPWHTPMWRFTMPASAVSTSAWRRVCRCWSIPLRFSTSRATPPVSNTTASARLEIGSRTPRKRSRGASNGCSARRVPEMPSEECRLSSRATRDNTEPCQPSRSFSTTAATSGIVVVSSPSVAADEDGRLGDLMLRGAQSVEAVYRLVLDGLATIRAAPYDRPRPFRHPQLRVRPDR